MKIEYGSTRKLARFRELENGTVFLNPADERIYMKIEDIDDDDGEPYNNIDLLDGTAGYLVENAKVYIVDATLNIKE